MKRVRSAMQVGEQSEKRTRIEPKLTPLACGCYAPKKHSPPFDTEIRR
jgi:hypothetical protein